MTRVVKAAGPRRRGKRHHDAENGRRRERRQHQKQGELGALQDEPEHRLPVGEGEAELPLGEVQEIEAELGRERLVETELVTDLIRIARRRGEVPDERLDRIARHDVDDQEVDDEDREDHRNGPTEPGQEKAPHQG